MAVAIQKNLGTSAIHRFAENINVKGFKGLMNSEVLCKWLRSDTFFYGAGKRMQELLQDLDEVGIRFNYKIYDKNASSITEMLGKKVKSTDVITIAATGQIMVVMIESTEIFEQIFEQYTKLGFRVLHRGK